MIEESCYMWQEQALYMMNAFSYFFARENFFLSCIVELHENSQLGHNLILVAITFIAAIFISNSKPLVIVVDDKIDHSADN